MRGYAEWRHKKAPGINGWPPVLSRRDYVADVCRGSPMYAGSAIYFCAVGGALSRAAWSAGGGIPLSGARSVSPGQREELGRLSAPARPRRS